MQWSKARKVVTGTKWGSSHRTSTWCNIDSKTNRVCWHNNVGIENCGINVVTTNGLQCELCCKFGLLDCVKDASFTTQRFVFRKAASGLAHEPNRGVDGLLATGGCKKGVIREAGHEVGMPLCVMGFTLSVVTPRHLAQLRIYAGDSSASWGVGSDETIFPLGRPFTLALFHHDAQCIE